MIDGRTQAELDTLAKSLSDARVQLTTLELNTFQKVVAMLKPNQLAKAPEAFDLMGGIFEQTSNRGGGGMGGRGGGMGGGGGRGGGR
jgi:hypothetical protein